MKKNQNTKILIISIVAILIIVISTGLILISNKKSKAGWGGPSDPSDLESDLGIDKVGKEIPKTGCTGWMYGDELKCMPINTPDACKGICKPKPGKGKSVLCECMYEV